MKGSPRSARSARRTSRVADGAAGLLPVDSTSNPADARAAVRDWVEANVPAGALLHANANGAVALDNLARVMLTEKTYEKEYALCTDLATKREFLTEWYRKGNAAKKKVDSAIRIFDTPKTISYPDYLTKVVSFDA